MLSVPCEHLFLGGAKIVTNCHSWLGADKFLQVVASSSNMCGMTQLLIMPRTTQLKFMNVFLKISRRWLREIRHWLHGKLMRWLLLSSLLYCNIHWFHDQFSARTGHNWFLSVQSIYLICVQPKPSVSQSAKTATMVWLHLDLVWSSHWSFTSSATCQAGESTSWSYHLEANPSRYKPVYRTWSSSQSGLVIVKVQ